MHIRLNANIDNKTYVGERDLQKVIRCLLTYGNQFIRHNWKPFSSKFWNSNSMEFYTILKLSALMIPMVPFNNKKKGSMTPAVPWNSMELRVHQFRWHEQFHGIPWNLECANFADRSSSMEFHGTYNKPISMTRTVPWISYHHTPFSGTNFNFLPWIGIENQWQISFAVILQFCFWQPVHIMFSHDMSIMEWKLCWWSIHMTKIKFPLNLNFSGEIFSVMCTCWYWQSK